MGVLALAGCTQQALTKLKILPNTHGLGTEKVYSVSDNLSRSGPSITDGRQGGGPSMRPRAHAEGCAMKG